MSKKTILIADDASFMRMIIKKMIEEDGIYQVVGEAVDGLDAANKAKELKPDIITMDVIMPEMDGLGAIKEILKHCPNTKIIMVSSMGNYNIINEAIQLGAFAYIVKPVKKDELYQALQKAI